MISCFVFKTHKWKLRFDWLYSGEGMYVSLKQPGGGGDRIL